MTILAIILFGFACYAFGRIHRREHYIAIGWDQYREQQIAKDRARRDAGGRFKGKN